MTRIVLLTSIAAPIERCFDLARSIDLHMASTNWSGERAIGGVTSGFIGAGREVTWQGRHFGLTLTHRSRITAYERPKYFQDCMVSGRFRRFCHDHYFDARDGGTQMRDEMEFEAPLLASRKGGGVGCSCAAHAEPVGTKKSAHSGNG